MFKVNNNYGFNSDQTVITLRLFGNKSLNIYLSIYLI